MNHLLAERILNQPLDTFQSADMAHGNEFEAQAVASYEFQQDWRDAADWVCYEL